MVVIDTDGSAFITKAEFDSLKNNFQAQIDNYNNSIDSKIDGAIAAYLAGVSVAQASILYYDPSTNYRFVNDLQSNEMRADDGYLTFNAARISHVYGLTGSKVSTSDTWYYPKDNYLVVYLNSYASCYNTIVKSIEWRSSEPAAGNKTNIVYWKFNKTTQVLSVDPELIDKTWIEENVNKKLDRNTGSTSAVLGWLTFIPTVFMYDYCKNGITVSACSYSTSTNQVCNRMGYGNAQQPQTITNDYKHKTDSNIYTKNILDKYGIGIGYNSIGGIKYINKLYNTISIVNNFNSQQFTYKDASSQASSASGWNDETMIELECYPDLNWSLQENGNKVPLNSSDTTNKTYYSFQATKMQDVNPIWSENTFLGSTANDTNIVVFNEECVPVESGIERITNSETQFNRNGYYMDTSGNVIPKTDNIIKSGEIRYKKMLWSSETVSPSELCIQTVSGICGESVHLGGGMPLCQAPTETTGSKVKLHYKVTKLDGTPIDAAAGDIPIKITLSNKQFVNGNLAGGAANRGEFTATVNSSSPEGDWESTTFAMANKEKLWLNAYASTKGYNVVISNIDVS